MKPTPYFCLSTLVDHADSLQAVRRTDVALGDRIFLRTDNSLYIVRVLEGGQCLVTGGWFDKKGVSPAMTHIRGCTWGGSSIKMDIMAACGLCVEFGNRVITSSIRKIVVLPRFMEN